MLFPIVVAPIYIPTSGVGGFPFFFFFFLSFFFFLGPHPWHIEVPRLGVSSELQLLAYATAIAMRDLSSTC